MHISHFIYIQKSILDNFSFFFQKQLLYPHCGYPKINLDAFALIYNLGYDIYLPIFGNFGEIKKQ